MTPKILAAAQAFVRVAAEKRPGEKQSVALTRAARLLGASTTTVENIFYGEMDACTDLRAQQILARRTAVLEERLQYEMEMAARHQAETQRILQELRVSRGAECSNNSAYSSPPLSFDALCGSAPSPGGSQDDEAVVALAWGYGL